MNKEIPSKTYGGFLELESGTSGEVFHKNALALSHGRACLSYILDVERPRRVHVPFYTCGAMLDPVLERNIELSYYAVDQQLDPADLPSEIEDGALLIYINYFGLKSKMMKRLTAQYGNRLVADNCMSFFSPQYGNSYTYNSCRKFFGVPDGSFLYTPAPTDVQFERYKKYHTDHLISRMQGDLINGYAQFLKNEATFDCNIYGMSTFTEPIMAAIDYASVATQRRCNFNRVHERIGQFNRLPLSLDVAEVPHYYPLLVDGAPDRTAMANDGLFIPTLWPDMLKRECSGFEHEINLAKNVLPLPIDQRYTEKDMDNMISILSQHWIATDS